MKKNSDRTIANVATGSKLYETARVRKDQRLNTGIPRGLIGILSNSISSFILRSEILSGFISIIDLALSDILKGPAFLKNYKNYTTKKDDINVR